MKKDAKSIRTAANLPRFCRCGLCFSPEPTLVALDALTAEQWQRLEREPNLIVEDAVVEVEETEPPEQLDTLVAWLREQGFAEKPPVKTIGNKPGFKVNADLRDQAWDQLQAEQKGNT